MGYDIKAERKKIIKVVINQILGRLQDPTLRGVFPHKGHKGVFVTKVIKANIIVLEV